MNTDLVITEGSLGFAPPGTMPPALFLKEVSALLRFLHRKYPEQTYPAGLLQCCLPVLGILRRARRARSGAREAGAMSRAISKAFVRASQIHDKAASGRDTDAL